MVDRNRKIEKRNVIFLLMIIYFNFSLWFLELSTIFCAVFTILTILIYQYFQYGKICISRQRLKYVLLIYIWLGISCLLNGEFGIANIQIFVQWGVALLLVSSIPLENFEEAYINVMYILAFISLILFAILIVYPEIYSYTPLIRTTKWIGNRAIVHNVFVGVVNTNTNYIRNWGIFYEPGMYAFYLNFALFMIFNRNQRIDLKKVIILIVALLTTTSTNGYISLILILIMYFVNRNVENYKRVNKRAKRRIFAITFLFLIASVLFFINNPARFSFLVNKLYELRGGATSGSGYERLRAIQMSWEAFCKNPIVGLTTIGTGNYFKGQIGSFTPFQWFATYGIFYGLFCNLFYISYAISKKDTLGVKILGGMTLISLIISQGMVSNLLILSMILYQLGGSKKHVVSYSSDI